MRNYKYDITDQTKIIDGHKVYRVRAVKDFKDVKAGDVGGYIASGSSLSQDGLSWVYDESVVMGWAQVVGNAQVKDKSIIKDSVVITGEAEVIQSMIEGAVTVRGKAVVQSSHIGGPEIIEGDTVVQNQTILPGQPTIQQTNYVANERGNTFNDTEPINLEDTYPDSNNQYDEDDESFDIDNNDDGYGDDFDSINEEDSQHEGRRKKKQRPPKKQPRQSKQSRQPRKPRQSKRQTRNKSTRRREDKPSKKVKDTKTRKPKSAKKRGGNPIVDFIRTKWWLIVIIVIVIGLMGLFLNNAFNNQDIASQDSFYQSEDVNMVEVSGDG